MATQAETILSPIRSAPATGSVRYIPEVRLSGGNIVPELRTGDMSRDTIVADIASAQHDEVLRVTAIDYANGKMVDGKMMFPCWDASADIALDVLKVVLVDHSTVPGWCKDFLEQHLGCRTVLDAEREVEAPAHRYRRVA